LRKIDVQKIFETEITGSKSTVGSGKDGGKYGEIVYISRGTECVSAGSTEKVKRDIESE
jgi:hypothetical protein